MRIEGAGLSTDGSSYSPLPEHTRYLADAHRLATYRRALAAIVRRGAIVVDLGSGSGILGLLACQAGAGRVYCIDESRMLEVARTIVKDSGFADRVSFVSGHSCEVELPERADLVIADQMAPFGLGAGLLSAFADARQRFLKPDAVLMPRQLELFVAGVKMPSFREQLAKLGASVTDVDVSHFRRLALSDPRWLRVGVEQVLTEPASFATLKLGREAPEQLRATLELRATSSGELHGLGGWFSAELAQGVHLTNSPLSDEQIDRECLFLPFAEPVQVAEGEVLSVTLNVHDKNRFYAWHVQRKGKQGRLETVCKQTSLGSLLLSKKELLQTAPDYRPALNQRGVATRTVLDLCDEKRPLSEIIELTQERHAKLLPTRERAAEFVQRTLGRLVR